MQIRVVVVLHVVVVLLHVAAAEVVLHVQGFVDAAADAASDFVLHVHVAAAAAEVVLHVHVAVAEVVAEVVDEVVAEVVLHVQGFVAPAAEVLHV